MAWLAEDMDGWSREFRTFCIELVRSMLVFNIIGDQMYLPFGGGEAKEQKDEPKGVRAGHFGGFASQNMLAFISNSAARNWFRETHPSRCKALVFETRQPLMELP